MKIFFVDGDYQYYLELSAEYQKDAGVGIWAYFLMPNHTYIFAVPHCEDSLACLFRKVHRHSSRYINFRESWVGHLWLERFYSFVMDEEYLIAAVRYVELDPLRAKICMSLSEWPWSIYHAHISGLSDNVAIVEPMLERVSNWEEYLNDSHHIDYEKIRKYSRTGRPAGGDSFIDKLESLTGRDLKRKIPGPKRESK